MNEAQITPAHHLFAPDFPAADWRCLGRYEDFPLVECPLAGSPASGLTALYPDLPAGAVVASFGEAGPYSPVERRATYVALWTARMEGGSRREGGRLIGKVGRFPYVFVPLPREEAPR